jgi:2-keto-4-pentenoate hydratase/2-oxohepta-3-ene-1,7-dioic acid hydratase in catechol pathway
MRLVTYLPSHGDQRPRVGVLQRSGTEVADLHRLAALAGEEIPTSSVLALLQAGPAVLARVAELADALERGQDPVAAAPAGRPVLEPLAGVRLLAPVPRPGKILCVGVNYRDHVLEVPGRSLPDEPFVFSKLPSVTIGPHDPIVHPGPPHTVDYEVELACVIGQHGRRIPAARALEYVAGYTILNDVSARDVQFRNNQVTLGKNFESFAPMGPCLATPDELGEPQDVELRSFVNGEPRQRARTSTMLFNIPILIAHISDVCSLEPGDVISTGTPAGVGAFRQPPSFLQPGDVVRMEIDGIGAIENQVIADTSAY